MRPLTIEEMPLPTAIIVTLENLDAIVQQMSSRVNRIARARAALQPEEAAGKAAAYGEAEEPEEEMYCPISHLLLTEAVMTSTGHLYNETALRKWLRAHPGDDPISRQPISEQLVPAYAVRAMALRWQERGFH